MGRTRLSSPTTKTKTMMRPDYRARDYQTEARQAVTDGFKSTQRGLMVLPTGAGKNYVACSLIDAWAPKKCLFLADRNELISQPWDALLQFAGISAGVEKAEDHCEETDRVVVGSIQSMIRRYQSFRPDRWDYVIADEAHLSMSDSWQTVLKYFGQHARILGMTATPFRTDGQSLMKFYEAEFYRKTIDDLQSQGWLVPLEIENMGEGIDVNDLTIKKGVEGKKFDEQEVANRIEPHLERIARELLNRFSDRCTLAFLPVIEISKKFNEIAIAVGLRSTHVDGKDPDRKAKLEQFKRGELQLLTNSQLVHTGFDAPACSATLNLTPMFSTVRYQQIVGRSTRPYPKGLVDDPRYDAQERGAAISFSDKSESLILDPMWQFAEHGLIIPEALSASSLEEALEIRSHRQRTGQKNLAIAQGEFIRAREEEMLRKLQEQHRERQRREEGVIAVSEFAIRTGNHFLASYQPVYSRDSQPVKPFDKLLLKQRGIDPESVTCAGAANLAIRAVNIRRANRLAEIPVVQRLIDWGFDAEDAYKLKSWEAGQIVKRRHRRASPR
jgi:superfamily II DNA or RNA helicase